MHYIPLEKDFSNFDEVVRQAPRSRRSPNLTENAYRDLIASGRYSYGGFVEEFDDELVAAGLVPGEDGSARRVRDERPRARPPPAETAIRLRATEPFVSRQFPGRRACRSYNQAGVEQAVKRGYRRWRYKRWTRAVTSGRDG